MKKTLTINLGGSVFHIEDDAYLTLDRYLENLKQNFKNDPESEEIIADIEARIAEIFHEEMGKDGKAVTIQMVNLAIETLGTPNDIADNDVEEEQHAKSSKKLFRDGNRKVFGGVCSGLANYMKMDPVLMRVIFLILFIATSGGFFFVYLVIWIAVPEAISTAQQMEMKGEKVNVSSIEKKVKHNKQTPGYNPQHNAANVGETILKIFAWIIGGFFLTVILLVILSLLAALFGLTVASTVLSGFLPELFVPGQFFLNLPPDMVSHTAGSAFGMILFVGAPILLILFIISKVFFKHNGKVGWVIFLSLALWIAGVVILATSSLKLINRASDMNISILGDDNNGALVIDGDTVFSYEEDFGEKFKMKLKSKKGSFEFNEGKNAMYFTKLFTAQDTIIINVASTIENEDNKDLEHSVQPHYQIVNTSDQNLRIALNLDHYEMHYDDFKIRNPIFTWEGSGKELLLRKQVGVEDHENAHNTAGNVVVEIPDGMVLSFENDADELFENLTQEEKEFIIPGKFYKMQSNEIIPAE